MAENKQLFEILKKYRKGNGFKSGQKIHVNVKHMKAVCFRDFRNTLHALLIFSKEHLGKSVFLTEN